MPKKCFSKEGLPKERAVKQMQAIAISEKEGGKRETYAEARAREAREQEEWKKRNEEKKAKEHRRTGREAKDAQLFRLTRELEAKKQELASRMENKPREREQMIKNYNDDIEKLNNYDYYSLTNTRLRDALDKQYGQMLRNMGSDAYTYGELPDWVGRDIGKPEAIKYVYEHYGQAKPNFWDSFNDAVSFVGSMIPGMSGVFDVLDTVRGEVMDMTRSQPQELEQVDYNIINEDFENALDAYELEIEDMGNEQKQLDEELANIEQQKKRLQEEAGLEGMAKPLTARLGGKVLLKKTIVDKFFPSSSSYKVYVEPFVGGGSVFFYKDKDDHKEVVNDLDPLIYTIFKGFQKYPAERIAKAVNGDYDRDDFERIKASTPGDEFSRFIKDFLVNRLSYFAKSKAFGKPRISSSFEGYQERLQGATILKQDWLSVIKRFNKGKDVFFYLDPPMAKSDSSFDYSPINVDGLKKAVDAIDDQGNLFLISMTADGIDKFKAYNTFKIKTKYVGRRTRGGQTEPREEWIVTNYKPMVGEGKFGKSDRQKALERGEASSDAFMKQLEKLRIEPNDYMVVAKHLAKSKGYDPEKLSFATDGDHKLVYDSPQGIRKFGKVGYGDYIIWSYLERRGEVPKGTANEKRNRFHKSHKAMSKIYGLSKYTPNELALNINW